MTDHDINRTLAEFMGWELGPIAAGFQLWFGPDGTAVHVARDVSSIYESGPPFDPCTDSNHLREVLAKLTADQWDHLLVGLVLHQDAPKSDKPFWQWMLTCDPRIIAQAVAEVVK